MSANHVKNQSKKPRRNSPCKENREEKKEEITRGDTFLPERNLHKEHHCTQWFGYFD